MIDNMNTFNINTFKDVKFDLSKISNDIEYKDYLFDLIETISEDYLKPMLNDDIIYAKISIYNFNQLMIGHDGIIASEQSKFELM